MTAGPYYIDYDLTLQESTSHPHNKPALPFYYSIAIRRRRRSGWVFRLHGDFPRHEALAIVANLNAPHRHLERAA